MVALLQLPGVMEGYIPAEGARMIAVMESRIAVVALALAALLVVAAVVLDQGRALMAMIPPSLRSAPRWLLVVLLFVGHYEFHYYIYAIPAAIAEELIISEAEMGQLNEDFIEASKIGKDGEPIDAKLVASMPWYSRAGLAVSLLNPVSYILQETAMSMIMTVYFFSVPFVHYVWLSLVTAQFAFGKLVIVFGVLPVWGPRVLTSYFGAIVSLSLWQMWNAFCAFMVKHADAFFHSRAPLDLVVNGSTTDIINHYAMIPVALAFTVMSLMGLTFIYLIFGFSKFTMAGGFAMTHGTSTVVSAGTQMVMMPVNAFLAMKTGGASLAGGGGVVGVAAPVTAAASAAANGAQYGGGGGSYSVGSHGWMTSGAGHQVGGGNAPKQIGGRRS